MSKGRLLKGKAFLSLIIAFALIILTCATSFAWLQIKKDTDVSVSAGGGADIVIYYATYDKATSQYNFDKGQSLSSNNVFGEKFTSLTSPLHLGEIENLLARDESNVSWYAFKIKTNGNRYFYNLRLSFVDNNPFNLYSVANDQLIEKTNNPDYVDNINNVKTKNLEKLVYSDNLIISKVSPDLFFTSKDIILPDVNSEHGLPIENTQNGPVQNFDKRYITCYTPLDGTLNNGDDSYKGQYDANDEYYYVYLRVFPNLDEYGNAAEYISQFMPCVMTFNLQFTITTSSKPFSERNK